LLVAGQFAVKVHVPVPESMVTVALALAGVPVSAPTEHTPAVPARVGITPELVVAVTLKALL
jgi:hypothetical protein